jgi:hypothetical protein
MGAIMLAIETNASAAVPRFRVVPIVRLDFTPNSELQGSAGINNKGQAVYGFMQSGQMRAWVWLPESDYGMTAGFHDIGTGIALDINDSTWIITVGTRVGTSSFYALLLIPYGPCPEDVNQDGVVNSADLAIVITSTGACPEAAVCWADVNGDCVVNFTDRRLVMQAYGPCGGQGSGLTADDLEKWFELGADEIIDVGKITAEDIAKALDEPTEIDRLVALYLLLAN